MSRLFDHLAEIVETADGGFQMTPRSRQYFCRFLRQHGLTLRQITTHTALIEALRICNAADFAALRQRRHLDPIQEEHDAPPLPINESQHRLVA